MAKSFSSPTNTISKHCDAPISKSWLIRAIKNGELDSRSNAQIRGLSMKESANKDCVQRHFEEQVCSEQMYRR